MPKARIYRPDKTAMQSGKAGMKRWILEFAPDQPYFIDGLMGWTGMRDMTRQLVLRFATKEEAVAYAKANGIEFELFEPHVRRQVKKTCADNFRYQKPA